MLTFIEAFMLIKWAKLCLFWPKLGEISHFYPNSVINISKNWSKEVRITRSHKDTTISCLQKISTLKNRPNHMKKAQKLNKWHFLVYHPPFGPLELKEKNFRTLASGWTLLGIRSGWKYMRPKQIARRAQTTRKKIYISLIWPLKLPSWNLDYFFKILIELKF